MKKKTGFSLLEILVVIVILSVMASILIPTIGNNHRRARDEAETLVLLINMAKQEAIMNSRVWQLVLDSDNKRYHFQRLGNLEFEDVSIRPLAGSHALTSLTLGELRVNGRIIPSGQAQVYLFPTGEQDTLMLALQSGDRDHIVTMGPVGPALRETM